MNEQIKTLKVNIAYAGRGNKIHKGNSGIGASASCMNNSINGRLSRPIFVVEIACTDDRWADYDVLDAEVLAWGKENAATYDLCGKCFKGVAA